MENIVVQTMTEADLEEVLAIETVSFPLPWSRQHFLDELSSSLSFPLVARKTGDAIAGYICCRIVLDEGSILNVAVSPGFRGKGIGRLLVKTALIEMQARGAAFVTLEVRPTNRPALSLYESLGFVVTGKRKAYYENGEDAVLMEYEMKSHGGKEHAL